MYCIILLNITKNNIIYHWKAVTILEQHFQNYRGVKLTAQLNRNAFILILNGSYIPVHPQNQRISIAGDFENAIVMESTS